MSAPELIKRLGSGLNTLLHRAGWDAHVSRFPGFETLGYYLRKLEIEVVIDVGANEGQFAEELRSDGFTGRIISFEPLPSAFAILQAKAVSDPGWELHHLALGESDGTATLHVSKKSVFSSLLPPSDSAAEIGYAAETVSHVEVTVKALDSLWPALGCAGRRTLLKIDTQGFDMAVLRGAGQSLPHLRMIQLEIPLRSMYAGQPTVSEVLPHLRSLDFYLVELSKVCRAPRTGELLEMDGLFVHTPKGSS